MILKLLDIELQYNSEEENVESIIRYGEILDNKNIKNMEKQLDKIKEELVNVIRKELGGE